MFMYSRRAWKHFQDHENQGFTEGLQVIFKMQSLTDCDGYYCILFKENPFLLE